MKRLLKISFDSLFFSLMPIIQWFLLGLLVEKNLINVFSITYPLQFIYSFIKSVFGVAPNIQAEKENEKNFVMSGLVLGMFFTFLVFGLFYINVDNFIRFMNIDVQTYHDFCAFSISQLALHSIFAILMEKLYYEEKNTKANVYTILFNIVSLGSLLSLSLITKNQMIITNGSLLMMLICIVIMFILEYSSVKMTANMFVSSGIRVVSSFLPTPFCTSIGQLVSSIYQLVTTSIYMKKFKESREKEHELRSIETGI